MQNWNILLAVGAGGAAGAALRFLIAQRIQAATASDFPWGILMVNVVGALLMGVAFVWLTERSQSAPATKAFLTTGILGGFTTFSTFALDAVTLANKNAIAAAAAYVLLSVVVSLVAIVIGMVATRALIG